MKYDPDSHALQFTNEDEVTRFHMELTALLRVAVTDVSRHGEAEEGKAAAQGVFKEFPGVMRALNQLRRHLQPTGE
ncbi:MAG: hypothetical protein WCJ30_02975 [Deltaproteobacteria bacterium]